VRRNLIARNLSRYGEERPQAVDRVLERMTLDEPRSVRASTRSPSGAADASVRPADERQAP